MSQSPPRLVRVLALLAVSIPLLGWLRPPGIGHNTLLDERPTEHTQGELLSATVIDTVEDQPIHRLRFRYSVDDVDYERESYGRNMPIPAGAPVTVEYLMGRPSVARVAATKVRIGAPSMWFWITLGVLIAALAALLRRPGR